MKHCIYIRGSTCKDTGKGKPPEACLERGCDGRIIGKTDCENFIAKKTLCEDVIRVPVADNSATVFPRIRGNAGLQNVCGIANPCKNKGEPIRKGSHIRECKEPMVETYCEDGKARGCLA